MRNQVRSPSQPSNDLPSKSFAGVRRGGGAHGGGGHTQDVRADLGGADGFEQRLRGGGFAFANENVGGGERGVGGCNPCEVGRAVGQGGADGGERIDRWRFFRGLIALPPRLRGTGSFTRLLQFRNRGCLAPHAQRIDRSGELRSFELGQGFSQGLAGSRDRR